MKRILAFGFILYVSNSCGVKDKYTVYEATLHNNTSQTVKVLFYKDGRVYYTDTLKIAPSEKVEIANGVDRGADNKEPGFTSNYFGSSDDSIVVVFNDSYRVTHYANTPSSLSLKHYLNSSSRNIYIPSSYQFSRSETKGVYTNHHDYYFTDDDYNFAKD